MMAADFTMDNISSPLLTNNASADDELAYNSTRDQVEQHCALCLNQGNWFGQDKILFVCQQNKHIFHYTNTAIRERSI